VFLLYDSDEAGQKATFRSGLELLQQRAAVRVVSLPPGEDPDTFVREQGRAAMEVQLSQAIDLFDRQVQLLERRGWFTDIRRKIRAKDRLLPTIRATADPVTKDLYLSRLSEATGIEKAILAAEADEMPSRGRRPSAPAPEAPEAPRAEAEGEPSAPAPFRRAPREEEGPPAPYAALSKQNAWRKRGKNAGPEWQATAVPPRPRRDEPVERALVRAMLTDRDVVERVAERHGPQEFRDADYRALFSALMDASPDDDLEAIAGRLEAAPLDRLRELTEGLESAEIALADVALNIGKLDARVLREQCDEIRREMSTADGETKKALLSQLLSMERELRLLQPMRSPRGRPQS
jgi:DNA primase